MNASDFLTGASAMSITSATFSFWNSDDINHVMTPAIYSDASGKPGTLEGTFSTFAVPLSTDPSTPHFTNFTATSAGGITLAANTTYWIAISVDQATDEPFPVLWNTTSSQATDSGSVFLTVSSTAIQYSQDGGSTWNAAPASNGIGNTLFSLSGSVVVPEPATVSLLAGVLALGVTIWRRRPTV